MKNIKQPWFIRRVIYLIVGIVGIVLAGFGIIDEGQIDAISASPLLGTIAGFIAAAFTHQGSDSTVTAQDVADAAKTDPEDIASRVVELINTYGEHAAETASDAAEQTIADYYNGLK